MKFGTLAEIMTSIESHHRFEKKITLISKYYAEFSQNLDNFVENFTKNPLQLCLPSYNQ